ncbi:MAG: hypothetical protein C0404_00955 [Verrucomicrobia bacterium]|nr:hypothetical protein [Verrucomicrobiota bacterium]
MITKGLMRNIIWIPLACLVVSGCSTVRNQAVSLFGDRDSKVAVYIEQHPALSSDVKAGLRAGTVAKGMNGEEVKLCMGRPSKVESSELQGVSQEIWSYKERSKADTDFRQFDVPVALLTFAGSSGEKILTDWEFYGANPHDPQPAKAKPAKTEPPAAQPAAAPRASSVDWPTLKLDRVLVTRQGISAFINDQEVKEGSTIEGATVVFIRAGGVTVKYKGETKVLKREN